MPTKGIFWRRRVKFDSAPCICGTRHWRKNGKVHRYWRLVRSVRVGRRVVQQTVAHLGELDEHGRIEARALARHLIGAPEQAPLFDDGSEHVTVPVRLKGIRVERSRVFGDVYLALALWRGLGLEELCERLLPAGQERISWAKMAAVLVSARFCEPSSELHIAEDWYRRTALSDLLQLGESAPITRSRRRHTVTASTSGILVKPSSRPPSRRYLITRLERASMAKPAA